MTYLVIRNQTAVIRNRALGFTMGLIMVATINLQAQWRTQTINLIEGWNAVYLHVTPPADTLANLVSAEPNIQEIWMWKPSINSQQFVENPQEPVNGGSRWVYWAKTNAVGSELQQLAGNTAYLVRMAGTAGESWPVKGRPVPPRYQWTSTGLNFIGLPTRSPAPTFSSFFAGIPVGTELGIKAYRYTGGLTPVDVLAPAAVNVNPGAAYWLRSGSFNRYFGPFELIVPDATHGFRFSDTGGQLRMYLRNANENAITVQMQLVGSETPPAGETAIEAIPPIVIRGAFSPTNLTYSATHLLSQPSQAVEYSLQPRNTDGSVVEIVLGINRTAMTATAGSLYAGMLRFTDSLNHTEIHVPISAVKESHQGLWVGDALITEVRHNLLQRPATASAGN